MGSRAVVSWSHSTTQLWYVMCGGSPAWMQEAAVQVYVVNSVDVSADVRRMLASMEGIELQVFTPRGRVGIALTLTEYLGIPGKAIVTIDEHGLPQDAGEDSVARARVDDLWHAFSEAAEL